jgi:hypothetical protein
MPFPKQYSKNIFTHVRRVGNQFSEEDFLVGVEGVDDQTHELLNISIECESFRHDY